MSHLSASLLPAYNSLTDKHLTGYFSNTRIRRHLVKAGLITRSGTIVPDKEYKQKLMRKDHQQHMRECLAQAIFHKVLDIERHHNNQIKRRLADLAQKERVNKVKVERSKRYEEDIGSVLSPKPPSAPRNGYAQHSGPEAEQSESSESLGSSRPNTAPGKMQRPIRLRPILSGTASSTRRPRVSLGDTEQLTCYTLDRDIMARAAMGKFSCGISPYRLPVINNFVTPVPPPTKEKGRSYKGPPNGTVKGRKLRPTTAPNVTMVTKESKFHKTSTHSNVSVTMVYYGKSVHLSRDDMELGDEVKVFQQHCGGENLCVYKGKLLEGDSFQFVSRRHRGFPFSLTFFLNGMQVDRLSSCCEFRHRRGSRLGGKHGYFGFSGVSGASPCYRCIIAMGLDKKPTPPPKRIKGEANSEGFMGTSSELAVVTKDADEDEKRENQFSDGEEKDQSKGKCEQGRGGNEQTGPWHQSRRSMYLRPAKDWFPLLCRKDYEEDFEADDEKTEESGPRPDVKKSDEGEDGDEDQEENKDVGKDVYTDSEAEEAQAREMTTPSRSSTSATFSSGSSKDDSESDADEEKDSVTDGGVCKVELQEEDVGLEEPVKVDGDGATSLPGDENGVQPLGEPMETTSTGDAENGPEIKSETEPPAEEGLTESSTATQTGMERAVAMPVESTEDGQLDRAKSVQEKLAEAIMTEVHCCSEVELSDTSTEEEEESSSAPDTALDQKDADLAAALSLPRLPCAKPSNVQGASAEGAEIVASPTEDAGCDAEAEQDTGEIKTDAVSDREVGDGAGPPQEAEDPLPDAETTDNSEGASTKPQMEVGTPLSSALEDTDGMMEGGLDMDEMQTKMETPDTETGECERRGSQSISGEAQSPDMEDMELNIQAAAESTNDAEDVKATAEQIDNDGEQLIEKGRTEMEEPAATDMHEGSRAPVTKGNIEDDWPTAMEGDECKLPEAEERMVSKEQCGEVEGTGTQQDLEEGNEVSVKENVDDGGQIDEEATHITEATVVGSEEGVGRLEKSRTIEPGNEHGNQEEDDDVIKDYEDDIGEEDAEFQKEETNEELSDTGAGGVRVDERKVQEVAAEEHLDVDEEGDEVIRDDEGGTDDKSEQLNSACDTEVGQMEAMSEKNGEAGAGGVTLVKEAEPDDEEGDTEECDIEAKMGSKGSGNTEAEEMVDLKQSERDESKEEENFEKQDVENISDIDHEIEEEKTVVQPKEILDERRESFNEADHAATEEEGGGGDAQDNEEVRELGVEYVTVDQDQVEGGGSEAQVETITQLAREIGEPDNVQDNIFTPVKQTVRPETIINERSEETKSPSDERPNSAEEPEQIEAAELDFKKAVQDEHSHHFQPKQETDSDLDSMQMDSTNPQDTDSEATENKVNMVDKDDEGKRHDLVMSEGLVVSKHTVENEGLQVPEAVDIADEKTITNERIETEPAQDEEDGEKGDTVAVLEDDRMTESQGVDQRMNIQPMKRPDTNEEEVNIVDDDEAVAEDHETDTEAGKDQPFPEQGAAHFEPEGKDEELEQLQSSEGRSNVEAENPLKEDTEFSASLPEPEDRSRHAGSTSSTPTYGGYKLTVGVEGQDVQPVQTDDHQKSMGHLKYIQTISVNTASP